MKRILQACRRPLLVACVAGLGIAGTWGGAAVASAPYTVSVSVTPAQVSAGGQFTVTASGASANLSRLKVFLNRVVACKLTAAGDAAVATDHLIINTNVVHGYIKTKGAVGANPGNHLACAYLTSVPPPSPTLLRARASAPYTVG